jgi:ferredoxin
MVKIDKSKCIGCGACVSTCPEGFEMIGEKAHIKDSNASCIKQAALNCPTNAILLDEEDSDSALSPDDGKDAQEKQEDLPFKGRGVSRRMGQGFGRGRGMGGRGLHRGKHRGRGNF